MVARKKAAPKVVKEPEEPPVKKIVVPVPGKTRYAYAQTYD